MTKQRTVYLLPWTGDVEKGVEFLKARYPGEKVVVLNHRALREGGWKKQARALMRLRGRALVFFFRSIEDLNAPLLLPWSGLLHHCSETVIADEEARVESYRPRSWWRLAPATFVAIILEVSIFLVSWFLLQIAIQFKRARILFPSQTQLGLDIAYLFPYPQLGSSVGGAMSHVRGFLSGLAEERASCEIFSGVELPGKYFPTSCIPTFHRPFLFWESQALAYNGRFANVVRRQLNEKRVSALYQRHGRFVVAGALLSLWMRVPLILEYNGSEVWVANNWDPSRFRALLRLCERFSLSSASLIVVVSEALREELLRRGIAADRILVNPNAVDPTTFRPDQGGIACRRELGFDSGDIVACFVGTFSYWHGIPTLQEAIVRLLAQAGQNESLDHLRFLMIGDGPLRGELSGALAEELKSGRVLFTGSVAHHRIPGYLDAADILLSPHVPMRDGSPFFGSPTKLFEYMAMGKAIIASNLDQIGEVLRHEHSAWLVSPGSVPELVAAVEHLACHPELRERLGRNARKEALARHTWRQNAGRVLRVVLGTPARRGLVGNAADLSEAFDQVAKEGAASKRVREYYLTDE